MKKGILTLLILASIAGKAQSYGKLNEILSRLEERKGINQKVLENISIDQKRFVLINDFQDHTERNFMHFDGKKATFVEIFDDKKTGESSSNVFSGDIVRKKNIISLRADLLENKKIPIAITKTLLLTEQKGIYYLIDVNNKDRWIDEKSFGQDQPQLK